MADEQINNGEVKTFGVVNTSVRLVHMGNVTIPPGGEIVQIVDDEKGINRADVESSEYLDFADNQQTKETKNQKNKGGGATATGAGWSNK